MSKHKQEQSSVEPRLLNKEHAASYLSISPRLLDELVRRGDIQSIRVPGVRRVAFDRNDLARVVDVWKDGHDAIPVEAA